MQWLPPIRVKWLVLIISIVGVISVGSALALSGERHGPPSSAPGIIAPTAAASALPLESSVPSRVVEIVRGVASRQPGGNQDVAERSLRILRSNVEGSGSALFMYDLGDGTPCLMLVGRGGGCQVDESTTPGVTWLITGTPSAPDHAVSPSLIFGLAADNVARVEIQSGQDISSLRVINNAFTARVPNVPERPWNVTLRFTYTNGEVRAISVPPPPVE